MCIKSLNGTGILGLWFVNNVYGLMVQMVSLSKYISIFVFRRWSWY